MYHVFHPGLLAIASIATGGQLIRRLRGSSRTLYLTFDDGPDPRETPRLLEALDQLNIRATFFLVGRAAEERPDLVTAIVQAGHSLANHSMTHAWLNRLPIGRQLDEIRSADRVLERFDRRPQHPFRPPHGKCSLFLLVASLFRPQKIVLWTHDSLDYRLSSADVISRMRSLKVRSGDILLFHDDGPVARESLLHLVPEWKAAGFGFATIS